MKHINLSRALLLAGVLAASGAAHAVSFDDDASLQSSTHAQTWFFPDGSSHTVNLAAQAQAPDTTALGAGPASLLGDESQASNTQTETWFFPDGHSVTIRNAPDADPSLMPY